MTHGPVIAARYRLDQWIGRGASGDVFRATDLQRALPVAIKLLASRGAAAGQASETWTRELAAAQRLQHPSIATVLDAGRTEGRDWLVLRLAKGASLERYVLPRHLLPDPLVLAVGARMADALAHAHSHGVVHRDLKPSNVMVDLPTMQVTLLDFGVARIDGGMVTRTGMTLGTPSYMSPEQLAGQPASPASDTYALGVLLFEMFTGQRPHRGDSLGLLLRSMATQAAAQLSELRPDLPPRVPAELQPLLSAEPGQRPGNLAALSQRLQAMSDHWSAPDRR